MEYSGYLFYVDVQTFYFLDPTII